MQHICRAWLLVVVGVLLPSCAASTYEVAKIPGTPSGMAAFRECQHTEAVATGYDSEGRHDVFVSCLRSIPGMAFEYQEQGKLTFPPGCSHLVNSYPTVVLQCLPRGENVQTRVLRRCSGSACRQDLER